MSEIELHEVTVEHDPAAVPEEGEEPQEPAEFLQSRVAEAEAAYRRAVAWQRRATAEVTRTEFELRQVIQRYMAALRRDLREAREQARAPLPRLEAAQDDPGVDMAAVLRNLTSSHDRQRIEAKQTLQQLGIRAVGPLLTLIQRESVRRERRYAVACAFAVFCIVLVWGEVLVDVGTRGTYMLESTGPYHLLLIPILLALPLITRPTYLQRRAAQVLADFDDVRVIGALAESLTMEDPYTVKVAKAGLKRLLPRVKVTDAGYFRTDQLSALYAALTSMDDQLVVAILRALEQIGDERALPLVEKLAERPVSTRAGQRIREAATECLPALLNRTGQERVGQTLLRATEAPDQPAEALLRPAAHVAGRGEDSLLRSVAEDSCTSP